MATFRTKPTYLWQLATTNLGSNATPDTSLLRIFEELADESTESKEQQEQRMQRWQKQEQG
jgi:uracil DNA glycosylase